MRTSKLVVALLIVCALAILVVQNRSPSLALVFLGRQTVSLPLAVWLCGAIALGSLTAIVLFKTAGGGHDGGDRAQRRRWQVRPDASDASVSNPNDFRTTPSGTPRDIPRDMRREAPRQARPQTSVSTSSSKSSSSQASSRSSAATEDWQAWGQRNAASQWEDWSEAGRTDPAGQNVTKRQRQDREKADSAINDMSQGWANSAQDTVYVAPGGSAVEDSLDDIAEGWGEWEAEPPAETAYAYGYQGTEAASRVDAVYSPADDEPEQSPVAASDDEDWGLDIEVDPAVTGQPNKPAPSETAAPATENDTDGEGVYDADYRVIIPPNRSLDDLE